MGEELTFDPDALRQRYRRERAKRLRADANDQYIHIAGEYAHYLDDPYVDRPGRPPLRDEVAVAVIGGGFAGLVAGARLKQVGIDDVRIIEKGGGFGGTWYWNRYPGAQCDVESYIYLPLLEECGYVPTEKYAHAPEILEHCQRIAEHFGLYDKACLSTEVTGVEWDLAHSRWVIRTNRGDEMGARFLVMGNGPFHRPKLPGIPGIETFRGHSFHTSRWDYDYTGGDSNGGLRKLDDKRVGVIGTGATAVQVRSPPGGSGGPALRVPAHAVVGRRAGQPADRSDVGGVTGAGMAEEADGELHPPHLRRRRRAGPGDGRLDRHHRQARRLA